MEDSQAQQMPVRNAQDLYLIGTIADEISAFVIYIPTVPNVCDVYMYISIYI